MMDERVDTAEIASRLAQGRNIDGTNKNITVLDITTANWDQSTDKIIHWQVTDAASDSSTLPWMTGKHTMIVKSYNAAHSIQLPAVSARLGGTVVIKADSSVSSFDCTVNAPTSQSIDQPGGSASSFVLNAPGVYTLEHLSDGWAVVHTLAY